MVMTPKFDLNMYEGKKVTEIENIFILTDYGDQNAPLSRIDFDTIEEAQDYLLDRLHMYGDICVTYKEITYRTEKYHGGEK